VSKVQASGVDEIIAMAAMVCNIKGNMSKYGDEWWLMVINDG
jgi:low affinity Fe/Cu permease